VDTLQGLPDLIAYGALDRQLEALSAQSLRVADEERRFARLDALQSALLVALPVGALLTVLALAISRVDGVYLATLALATTAAYEAILSLGQAALGWGSSAEAAARLFEFMDTPPAVTDPPGPAAPPAVPDITREGVTFRYESDQPAVFNNLSLHIAAGEHVAIIGESGAGKSTLVNLLVRFW